MNNSSESVNTTQVNRPVCFSHIEPTAVRWITTSVYLPLVVLALFGNALIIWIVYRNRRMLTAPNLLVVNIAVGDLLVAFTAMIPTAFYFVRNTYSWVNDGPFGQISCKLFTTSQVSSISCSIFSLTVLAFERFFAVVFPMRNIVTIRGTVWSLVVIWFFSFALSSPLLYASKVRISDGVSYCIENWTPVFDPVKAPAIYTVVSFVFLYAIPLLVIAVLYSVIAVKVWRKKPPGNTIAPSHQVHRAAKKNVLNMSLALVLVFAFCWILIHVNLFLTDFSDTFGSCGILPWLRATRFLLGHANSAINCCIYPLFSQEYLLSYKKCFKSLFSRCH